ncbi:hypothetical protein [Priestia megaterium]|uniref:hypothetical protein n=1 Tax=Priestia megaterium TaxID=1404 RepID=UPI0034574A1D
MNFLGLLYLQLNQSIGMTLEVATDTALFEGVLKQSDDGVLELEETSIGYEREKRIVFIPISSVNFIRVRI